MSWDQSTTLEFQDYCSPLGMSEDVPIKPDPAEIPSQCRLW